MTESQDWWYKPVESSRKFSTPSLTCKWLPRKVSDHDNFANSRNLKYKIKLQPRVTLYSCVEELKAVCFSERKVFFTKAGSFKAHEVNLVIENITIHRPNKKKTVFEMRCSGTGKWPFLKALHYWLCNIIEWGGVPEWQFQVFSNKCLPQSQQVSKASESSHFLFEVCACCRCSENSL